MKEKQNNIKVRMLRIDINKNDKNYKLFDEFCWRAKNLYNLALYQIRQHYIITKRIHDGLEITEEQQGLINDNYKWLNDYNKYVEEHNLVNTKSLKILEIKTQWYGEVLDSEILSKKLKETKEFRSMPSANSAMVLRELDAIWKGHFKSLTDFTKNPHKYRARPKMPNYQDIKVGRYKYTMPYCCKIKDGIFTFTNKDFKGITFKVPLKDYERCGKKDCDMKQVRFIPKPNKISMEIVYNIEVPNKVENNNIVGIDIGVNKLATISNNVHIKPFSINGKPLKSYNKNWNKLIAQYKGVLKTTNDKMTSKRLLHMNNKRNNHMETYMHKASKYIIDWCVKNNIGTIVIGKNDEWKQECNMGKVKNQTFVQIPHAKFISMIEYKAENVGINTILTEESYTSGTSFIDGELPIKKYYNISRRKPWGLFKGEHNKINSDVNGAYQIIKKVYKDFTYNEDYLHPRIININ